MKWRLVMMDNGLMWEENRMSKLKANRLARKFSINRLSYEANVGAALISMAERGKVVCGIAAQMKLARVFGMEPSDLFDESGFVLQEWGNKYESQAK
jgi:transcriptional regulator with XRE-family HTH domain